MRIVLKASPGMIYTDGKNFARVAYLSKWDSPDNWWEITLEEYNERMAQVYEEDLH